MSTIAIEIVDVTLEKLSKYEKLSVTFKEEFKGQLKTSAKAIMSFATPAPVWNTMLAAKKGDQFIVERKKDDSDKYWNWIEVHRNDGGGPVATAAAATPASRAPSFSENDAKRQRLIVRQNALTNATNLAAAKGGDVEDILQDAEQFAKWVLEE